jgi:hypothetical protein
MPANAQRRFTGKLGRECHFAELQQMRARSICDIPVCMFYQSPVTKRNDFFGEPLRIKRYHEEAAASHELSPHTSHEEHITRSSEVASWRKAGPTSTGSAAWHTGQLRGALSGFKMIFANSFPHSKHR